MRSNLFETLILILSTMLDKGSCLSSKAFLGVMTEGVARGYYFQEGRGARALSDLMHLSIDLEPAGHYCPLAH